MRQHTRIYFFAFLVEALAGVGLADDLLRGLAEADFAGATAAAFTKLFEAGTINGTVALFSMRFA